MFRLLYLLLLCWLLSLLSIAFLAWDWRFLVVVFPILSLVCFLRAYEIFYCNHFRRRSRRDRRHHRNAHV
jgi:hypothetical protein